MDGLENGAQPGNTPTGTEVATDQTATLDAPAVTSAATGDQPDSTPQAVDELAEFKGTIAKALGTEKKPDNSEIEPTEEAAAGTETDEPPTPDDQGKTPDLSQEKKGAVPPKLTDRPEWQKLTAIADKVSPEAGKEVRGILRTMFKDQHDLAQLVEQSKPAQEAFQEMLQSVGGNPQGLTNMRHLIRSYDSDPSAAIPMLKMLLQDAEARAGVVLSDPGLVAKEQKLQAAYDTGEIDKTQYEERRAELMELQKARVTTDSVQRQTQQQSQQQQKEAVASINQTENRWMADKEKKDPDFPALQELHKLYVDRNAQEFMQTNRRYPNPKETIDLLEKAYGQAKFEAQKFRPKARARQAITGDEGSSGNNRQQPANEFEEFQQTVASSLKRHR